MKKIAFLVSLILIMNFVKNAPTPTIEQYGCLVYMNNSYIFFMELLYNSSANNVIKDMQIGNIDSLVFNLCGDLVKPECKEANGYEAYINYKNPINQTNCSAIAGSNIPEQIHYSYIDNKSHSLTMLYNTSIDCSSEGRHLQYAVEYICNDSMPFFDKIYSLDKISDQCYLEINVMSRQNCPIIDTSFIFIFLELHPVVFALILGLSGLFFALFGKEFLRIILILSFALPFTIIIDSLLYKFGFLNTSMETKFSYIVMGVILLIGLGIGIALLRILDFAIMIIGAYGGFLVGNVAYSILLRYISVDNSGYVYYITIGVFIIAGALIIFFIKDQAVIIITSLIGGYCTVRAITLFDKGGFLSEALLFQMIKEGKIDGLPPRMYYYLIGMLVVAAGGFIFQECRLSKKENKDSLLS